MLKCFQESIDLERIDREPFKIRHSLLDHPALGLQNLARAIPSLDKADVYYSSGLLKPGDDFDRAQSEHPNGLTLERTIDEIRTSDSYIMVRSPENDPSFRELFEDLASDVRAILGRRGMSTRLHDPKLYLFIASPNSLTPFHIDRYSTFLMQFRGSKSIFVFPQWEERVVSSTDREGFVAYSGVRPVWRPELDQLATHFRFGPGEMLHIPFLAGHYVRNDPDEVSISLSIIFNTDESMRWRRALLFNHRVRPLLGRLGATPFPVAHQTWRDRMKSGLYRSAQASMRLLRGRSPEGA